MAGTLIPPSYHRSSEANLNSWVVLLDWSYWWEKIREHTRSTHLASLSQAGRAVHNFLLLFDMHAWRKLCWFVSVNNYSHINCDWLWVNHVSVVILWLITCLFLSRRVYIRGPKRCPPYINFWLLVSKRRAAFVFPIPIADVPSGLGEQDLRNLRPLMSLYGVGFVSVFWEAPSRLLTVRLVPLCQRHGSRRSASSTLVLL
jgi:hypothetical protein